MRAAAAQASSSQDDEAQQTSAQPPATPPSLRVPLGSCCNGVSSNHHQQQQVQRYSNSIQVCKVQTWEQDLSGGSRNTLSSPQSKVIEEYIHQVTYVMFHELIQDADSVEKKEYYKTLMKL
jgi:hypothetical protein